MLHPEKEYPISICGQTMCKTCGVVQDDSQFDNPNVKDRPALNCFTCLSKNQKRVQRYREKSKEEPIEPQPPKIQRDKPPQIILTQDELNKFKLEIALKIPFLYKGKWIKWCQSCRAYHELYHFEDPNTGKEYARCNEQRKYGADQSMRSYNNNKDEVNAKRKRKDDDETDEREEKRRKPEDIKRYNEARRIKHALDPEHNNKQQRDYREDHREEIQERDRNYYQKVKKRVSEREKIRRDTIPSVRFKMIFRNAIRRNLEFSSLLTLEVATPMMMEPCFYCGHKERGKLLSFDRLDNNKGYTLDNIVTCCTRCNRAKLSLDPITFIYRLSRIVGSMDSRMIPYLYRNTQGSTYADCKASAKKRGLEFSLTRNQHLKIKSRDCNYCRRGNTNIHKNGVDRVDSKVGYTVNNCVGCCTDCNLLKGELTIGDLEIMARRVANNITDRDISKVFHIPRQLYALASRNPENPEDLSDGDSDEEE